MDNEKCQCDDCNNEAAEPHVCPYRSEIHDDDETLCTCCADCTRECELDI